MEPNKRKREEDEERVIDGMISLTSERRNSSQTNRLEGTFFRKKKLSLFGTTFILQQRRRRSEHVDDNLDDVVTEAIDAISSQNPSIKVLIESFQSNQINNTNSNSSSLDDMTTAQSNLQFVEFVLFVFNLIEQITVFNDIPELPLPASLSSPDNSAEMKPNENKKEKFKFKASNPSTMFEKHWRDHFQELAHFKNVNGHCNVSRTTKGFEQLGNWLADQRRKLRRGKLTKEQYQMLTDLGVEWDRSYYFVARAVV